MYKQIMFTHNMCIKIVCIYIYIHISGVFCEMFVNVKIVKRCCRYRLTGQGLVFKVLSLEVRVEHRRLQNCTSEVGRLENAHEAPSSVQGTGLQDSGHTVQLVQLSRILNPHPSVYGPPRGCSES